MIHGAFAPARTYHAVEVIADVLLRHRELGELDQRAELALRERQRLQLLLPDADARIVARRERLQVEARAPRAHRHLAAGGVDVDLRIVGQRTQQVLQLACADRRRAAVLAREFRDRGDLHLEVGCGDVQLAVALLEQDVGENRQRVPAFDDSRHGLQRFEQRVSGYLF